MYAELGLLEQARAELKVLVTPGLKRIPRDALFVASLTYLADAVTIVGDRYAAATVYAELEPYRNAFVVVGHLIATYGAADRYLGALAETAGRGRDAERHYVQGDRARDRGRRRDLARAQPLPLRAVPRAAGSPRRPAVGRWRSSTTSSRRTRTIGMPALEQRASLLAGEIEQALDDEPEPSAAPDGALDVDTNGVHTTLTPREREILECLADGLSNADIGRALHISANTAANHVRSILLKTGCANRTEVAAWAVRRGVVSR